MSLSNGNSEVGKSGNVLFATFDPAYIWNFMTNLYEKSCKLANESELILNTAVRHFGHNKIQPEVGSGPPNLIEVCYLTEFLLETISLETYTETRVYLPRVFLVITQMLTIYSRVIMRKLLFYFFQIKLNNFFIIIIIEFNA